MSIPVCPLICSRVRTPAPLFPFHFRLFCFSSRPGRYVSANLDGVHAGCALVDRTLSEVDPVLFNYLESKFLAAKIYAFPLVMSLHACIPPLEEVVKLWDAIFSFGVHLEVLICVAQVSGAVDKPAGSFRGPTVPLARLFDTAHITHTSDHIVRLRLALFLSSCAVFRFPAWWSISDDSGRLTTTVHHIRCKESSFLINMSAFYLPPTPAHPPPPPSS